MPHQLECKVVFQLIGTGTLSDRIVKIKDMFYALKLPCLFVKLCLRCTWLVDNRICSPHLGDRA